MALEVKRVNFVVDIILQANTFKMSLYEHRIMFDFYQKTSKRLNDLKCP